MTGNAQTKLNALIDEVERERADEANDKARAAMSPDELEFAAAMGMTPAEYVANKDTHPPAAA
ncbi:MAG: hypothetical protein QOJ97_104 [Solirubrobacteraceae bacterium]|jgi:hypothetical protein|nr:hypothetical protein [Solirubrobacteraceae bacterium]